MTTKLHLSVWHIGLVVGDLLTLVIVTVIGFTTHGTLTSAGERLWATFLPLLGGWVVFASLLQAFDMQRSARPGELWRPALAMVLAAAVGVWLRGLWLGRIVVPVFLLVMVGISTLAILTWRLVFLLALRARR